MTTLAAAAVLLVLAVPSTEPAVVAEPRSGVTFAAHVGDLTLLGVGLRTKTFVRLKIYALGLYVADSALSGPLAVHKDSANSSAFFRDLIDGDFEKELVLKLMRNLSADQIQGSFRSHMPDADARLLDRFVSYFGATRAGQECVLHWAPGGTLETTVAGVRMPDIADRAFAQEVFAIWLRDRPTEDPIRTQVVSRAASLLQAAALSRRTASH